MRKIFFFLLITVFSIASVNAQTTKKRLNWGAKTGLNISKLRVDEGNMDPEWKSGFVAGVYFKIKAADKVAIQPEFLYSSMGGNFNTGVGMEDKYRLNYFSVPVLANISITKKFSALIGPEMNVLISARKYSDGAASKVTGDFKDLSFGFTGGFEVWPISKIGLSGRYHHGLSRVTDDESSALRTVELQNQNIQLTVAIRL